MTYFNRFKDVDIALPNIGAKTDGEYRMEAFRGVEFPKGSGKVFEFAGTRRLLMDWTPNLITNDGLDAIGAYPDDHTFQAGYCYVGTGNTPPSNTDTSMEAYVAVASATSYTPSAKSTAPYYGTTETRYLFQPNFAGGNVNLNEIGAGRTNIHTVGLTSRALTVDGGGTPTTISVLDDEYLECYYRRRNYPAHLVEATGAPTNDTGTVTIEGIDYDYTIRPIVVTYGGSYSVGTSVGWGTFMYPQRDAVGFNWNTYNAAMSHLSTCALGAVTSVMSAYDDACDYSGVSSGYTAGSYSKELWYQWAIGSANDAGGIGGLTIKSRLGAYQLKFDTPIPKVYGQIFTFYHNFTWNRKTTWV